MATTRQRVRMATIRSALDVVRAHRQRFTSGCGLVVFGGATTPDTVLSSGISAITNEHSDYALTFPPPYPHFIDAFALVVLGRFWLWHRAGVG